MRSPLILLVATIALCGTPARAQTTEFLVDFGDKNLQTGVAAKVWNDVHTKNASALIPLVDSAGNPSSLTVIWVEPMGRAEMSGPTVPAPGSALESLGWPSSATSDALYADSLSGVPEGHLELKGLDPLATYDFAFFGGVMGSPDALTSEYAAAGVDKVTALSPVTDNDGEVQFVRGVRPDPTGLVDLTFRNGTTNTQLDRRYYLNAMMLIEHAPGTQPPLISFDLTQLDTSRPVSNGPFPAALGLYTNDGSSPNVTIDVVDAATGLPPTWLSAPGVADVGNPIDLVVDPTGLVPRVYVADMVASAPDYFPATTRIVLTARAPGRLNILYYGNSYSATNGSVNVYIDRLAEEAGLDVPLGVPRYASGKNVAYHLNMTQVTAISRSFPLGELWDFVVIQGGTVEAALTAGNPPNFIANATAVMNNVRDHSPNVLAVIYQTWARGVGHPLYTGVTPTYPGGPIVMQAELEDGNAQLAASIEAIHGPGSATVAEAGETLQLRGFDPLFYKQDLSHPSPTVTVQAALTIFSRIFGLEACDLAIDFDTPGPVAQLMAQYGLDQDDWLGLTGIADRAGDAALRKYPGSEEDLLLTSGEPGATTVCGVGSFPAGKPLRFELVSPVGTYEGVPALLYFDVLGTEGGGTFVPPWSEVHFSASAWIQAVTPALDPAGLAVELSLDPELVGHTLLVQGVSEDPSPNTGNSMTLSDAHAVQVLLPRKFTPSQKP